MIIIIDGQDCEYANLLELGQIIADYANDFKEHSFQIKEAE